MGTIPRRSSELSTKAVLHLSGRYIYNNQQQEAGYDVDMEISHRARHLRTGVRRGIRHSCTKQLQATRKAIADGSFTALNFLQYHDCAVCLNRYEKHEQ